MPLGVAQAVGEEVPGMLAAAMGSDVTSDWAEGGPEHRSMKSERSFLSRA